jgi:4-alpha-glucanotransferase
MNRPGTIGNGNWRWRLQPGQLTPEAAERLRVATIASGRAPAELERAAERVALVA